MSPERIVEGAATPSPQSEVAPETRAATAARRARKRRRPSGEPPPLPRTLETTGRWWLALALVVLLVWAGVLVSGDAAVAATRADVALLRALSRARTSFLTDVARVIEFVGSDVVLRVLRWAALLVLVFFKRFRHLFVFFGAILAAGGIVTLAAGFIARPRPLGIDTLLSWEGPSQPSRPVAALAVTLVGICYSLLTPGRVRAIGKWATAVFLVLFSLSRLYLGVEHLSDVIVSVIIGVSIPLVAFRLLVPNEVFPVKYGRGRAAHLDVTGARGRAIRKALEEQLGLKVLEMKPFGLGGSGGSTPLRLRVEGEPHDYLFAKLYARNHLRADRWYKLGRTLLYGRLEDEGTFQTVRRLVQYEDYLLRVMRDAGLNVPESYGFAEITPEREYVLVTSFVEGSKELLEAEVTDEIIDDALRMVRALWDAGVAHRDVKPSNVLVRDDKVYLIDVAFGEVRPSPWRQAVDLANMMLVLAFRSTPDRVYARALQFFTPDEIAEAFAATHGVTMPSQSRNLLRKAQGNLVARFRELAPSRRPLSIQRWSWRRVALSLAVVLTTVLAVSITAGSLGGLGLLTAPETPVIRTPYCERLSNQLLLMSQSVPTASKLPCLASIPPGWSYDSLHVRDGSSEFVLGYGSVGPRSATVTLRHRCDPSGADEVPSDEQGARRFERIRAVGANFAADRFYLFEGGCIIYRFDFFGTRSGSLVNELSLAIDFVERQDLEENLREDTGLAVR